MFRTAVAVLCLMALTTPAVALMPVGADGVAHFTTHVTGDFNDDEYADMIISSSSGLAFLVLGTGKGYEWSRLEELPAAEAEISRVGWPAGSYLYVRSNGTGFEVFTRDTHGQVRRFSTTEVADEKA